MVDVQEARLKLRSELEAPPALRKFGSGWISGALGLVLGIGAFLLVLTIRAPGTFSTPELRGLEGNPWFRVGLHALFILAFSFSALSLVLRREKILGGLGLAITLMGTLFGGSRSTDVVPDATPLFFGLDWFVLRVILTGLLFVPVERLFPRHKEQFIFRDEWREDLFYFFISSMMVQILTFLTFLPAKTILAVGDFGEARAWVGSLPFLVQFLAIMFLTDLVQYWVHRAFHRFPRLWRFHAVHHSAQSMDWMAGARMHFFEIVFLRAATVIPMFVLGFSQDAMNAYIFVVYLYSTFVHANLGWRFGWIEKFLVTPRFHHWHHGIEKEAVDVNFSIHFPFSTRFLARITCPRSVGPPDTGLRGIRCQKVTWSSLNIRLGARSVSPSKTGLRARKIKFEGMARPSAEKIADIILGIRLVYGIDADSRIREAANRLTARALFEVLSRLDDEATGFPSQVDELMSAFWGEEVSTLIGFGTGALLEADEEATGTEQREEPTVYYLRLVFRDEDAAYYQFSLFPPLDANYVLGAGRKREGAVQHLRLELARPEALQTFIETCRSNPHFLRVEDSTAEEFERAPSNAV